MQNAKNRDWLYDVITAGNNRKLIASMKIGDRHLSFCAPQHDLLKQMKIFQACHLPMQQDAQRFGHELQ
jgi:hypothetical protein